MITKILEANGKQMGNRWEQDKNDNNVNNEENIIPQPSAETLPPNSVKQNKSKDSRYTRDA